MIISSVSIPKIPVANMVVFLNDDVKIQLKTLIFHRKYKKSFDRHRKNCFFMYFCREINIKKP